MYILAKTTQSLRSRARIGGYGWWMIVKWYFVTRHVRATKPHTVPFAKNPALLLVGKVIVLLVVHETTGVHGEPVQPPSILLLHTIPYRSIFILSVQGAIGWLILLS